MLKIIRDRFLYAFSHDIFFFSSVFVLISFPTYYYYYDLYVRAGALFPTYYIYLGMMFFVISYFITTILNISKALSLYLKPLFSFFFIIISFLNVICIKLFHSPLSTDYIEIIAGTNVQEAREFVSTYLSCSDIIIFFLLFLLGIFISIITVYKQTILTKHVVIFCLGVLVISLVGLSRNLGMVAKELGFSVQEEEFWKFQFDEIVDLRNHPTHPTFCEADTLHPSNIILIIGESFAKKHSSLYGYEVETNPLLKIKEREGNLTVFQNVESPATKTTKVFKYLLTTYQLGDEMGENKWYDCTNVLESFNILNYDTRWISCQNEVGLFDNLPSGYSKLCNHVTFDDRKQQEKYDDFLISAFTPNLVGRNLIVYHMYGQHPACRLRYPDTYCKFGPKKERGQKVENSVKLADYDNATLFNDYVVSSIIDLYKDQNAIILYFSDHGMDLFDSDDSYFGHANETEESQRIGKQIPFMIYQTDEFMGRYPQLSNRIKNCTQKVFCTDKLIYTLLDIAGYRFADNGDVEKYSLFGE